MAFQEVLTYDTAASLSFDTALVEIGGGVLRLKDLGGAIYSTANPSVSTQHRNMVSALTAFSEVKTVAGSDQVKYCLAINDKNYWYDTVNTLWTESNGTYAQSNLASEISANEATLFSQLSLVAPVYMGLLIFLHSATGLTRPSLTSNTLGYSFLNTAPIVINECLITAYLGDLLGDIPLFNSAQPTTLWISCDRAFFHGSRFIQPFTKSADFDSTGFAQLSVIETVTPGVKLSFGISYFDGISRKLTKLFSAIVPNTAGSTLNNITLTRYTDFG